jgi:hypothetical protein
MKMLILIQFALTAAAWRKGWNFKALLPCAAALGIGLYLSSIQGSIGMAVVVDFAVIGVLGYMASTAPSNGAKVAPAAPIAPAATVTPAA